MAIKDLEHNWVRTMSSTMANIVEIGMGTDRTTDLTRGSKAAVVGANGGNGIAIGMDAFVNKKLGIALGNWQKVDADYAIAEGNYFNVVERYGEKRRTFYDENNKLSRSWFEWYGSVAPVPQPPGPLPSSIFLHGLAPNLLVLKNNSALTFNIKIVGTDKNATPNVNGYHLSGTIKRGATAGTTAIVGAVTKTAWEDVVALDANIVADAANGALDVQIMSHVASTWYWAAAGWCVEFRW